MSEDQASETERDSSDKTEEASPVKIHIATKTALQETISESCAAILADFLPVTNVGIRGTSKNVSTEASPLRKNVSFNLTEEENTQRSREKPTNKREQAQESDQKSMVSLLEQKTETKYRKEPSPNRRFHYYTLPQGVIIQNGSEVREGNESSNCLSSRTPSASSTSKEKHDMSQKAKILAEVKEAALNCDCAKNQCHCRSVTRPTKAVTAEAKEMAKNLEQEKGNEELKTAGEPRRNSNSPVARKKKLLVSSQFF